ncbi:hypothetical protein C8J57DRAFT_1508422 [Mycena rebaudengoi]|nr:hypothetical protein C8J57DRAFT_1508422 [Mycena rebaudengoi]
MHSKSTLLVTLYSIVLVLAVGEAVLGSFCAGLQLMTQWTFSPAAIFGGMIAVVGAFTCIWVSVLLWYHTRRIGSPQALARDSTHLASFICFNIAWFALTIMLGSQIPVQCTFSQFQPYNFQTYNLVQHDETTCSFVASPMAIAGLLCILSGCTSGILYRAYRSRPPPTLSAPPLPIKRHKIQTEQFCEMYNIDDVTCARLKSVGFRPGDPTEPKADDDLKEAGFDLFTWKRVHAANLRFKAELAAGTFDP